MIKIINILIIGFLFFSGFNVLALNGSNDEKYNISFNKKNISYLDGPIEEWNLTFGTDGFDAFLGVEQTNDGGFIAIGTTNGRAYYNGGDFFLVKTTDQGVLEWQKTYGGTDTDWGNMVKQTYDGGYIVLGSTASFGSGQWDIWIVKTNEYGEEEWNTTYGGRRFEQSGHSIIETSDNCFLVIGLTSSYSDDNTRDAVLLKIDQFGNEVWNKTFGFGNDEHFWDLEITSDNGIILTGFSKNTTSDYAWVVKTDIEGNIIWEKKFGPANQGLDIVETDDGGYVFVAEAVDSCFSGYLNSWLIKIDKNGDLIWDKLFITPKGLDNFAVHHHILKHKDGGFILTGVTNGVEPVYSVGDLWLTRIDDHGNVLWEKILGGEEYESTYRLDITDDGGYIIAGATESYSIGNFDAWLVKISDFENQRPEKPVRPDGFSTGKPGENISFSSSSSDSDGDTLFYIWDWGDNNYSYWVGPYNSEDTVESSYSWDYRGEYSVRVKARDIHGGESEWSDPLTINMQKNKPIFTDNILYSLIPNDPFFDQQWELHNTGQTGGGMDCDIDAVEAWDIETGSPDITIAIIDSGIDLNHPDLIDNIWENSYEIPDNEIDDDNNGYVDDFNGYDFTFEDNNPYPLDHNGHGTVMSGVIAAMTNNEIGISGITWNCKIMPVKVVDANWTPMGNSIIDGIRYAADNGAKIICMAFEMYPTSSLKEAIDYAYSKGCLLVCSAGNYGNNRKTYPAAYENVIAVAGTDHSDHRMEYFYEFNGVWVNSSFGDWVDIAAPGENIYTTQPTYHVTSCDTWGAKLNYDIISGTTLAAPVVAGVAALVFSKNPDYTPNKVTAILKANSDPYSSEYDLGCGRVNAYNALMEFNSEPEKPDAPEGQSSGRAGNFYNYSVSTVDMDGDQIYYLFDWGDETESDWIGPYDSNIVCTESHNWSERGDYEIRVKAKDEFGLESEWSDPLFVSMPKSKIKNLSLFSFIYKDSCILQFLRYLINLYWEKM